MQRCTTENYYLLQNVYVKPSIVIKNIKKTNKTKQNKRLDFNIKKLF